MSSKVFQLESVKNTIHKNGFDLSQSRMFSTAPGIINVSYCKEVIPGDKFRINVENLTRTQTLNTAAYARAKEFWNFHFVPFRLLWRYFPDFIVQNSHSDSATSVANSSVPTQCPRFDLRDLTDEFNHIINEDYEHSSTIDELGFNYINGATKLLQQLGYGYVDGASRYYDVTYVSPFRLLAYQKVYQDFYRNTQWESYDSTSFNVDYLNATGSSSQTNVLAPFFDADSESNNRSIFQRRYANFKKDYFMGLRPSTQFGDVSVVSVTTDNGTLSGGGNKAVALGADGKLSVQGATSSDPRIPVELKGQFDILSLRKAEAIQRLREIQQANDFRYNAQINARFGFKIPDSRAQMAEFIGGHSNTLQITDVDSNATTGNVDNPDYENYSKLGQIGGKGIISSTPNEIDYEVKENGIIIGTYYILPIVNYPAVGIDKENLHLEFEDFYQPEFQNIGLSTVNLAELTSYYLGEQTPVPIDTPLGYAPRYLEYKTEIDKVYDEFMAGQSLSAWNVSIPSERLTDFTNAKIDYRWMKVPPNSMDAIFSVAYDGTEATNNFLVNAYITVKAIRPMSVDGMPF